MAKSTIDGSRFGGGEAIISDYSQARESGPVLQAANSQQLRRIISPDIGYILY